MMSREKHLSLLFISLVLFALDQITKFWVVNNLSYFQTRRVLGNFLRITLLYNPGGAFGTSIFGGKFYFWFSLSVAVIILVWYIFKFSGGNFLRLGVIFILGGALGNLFDRLRIGKVIDWIEVGFKISGRSIRWPVFNLADTYVTIGLIFLLISSIVENEKKEKQEEQLARPDSYERNGK